MLNNILLPVDKSDAFEAAYSTVITLLLVPALYLILNDLKSVFKGRKHTQVTTES